MASTTTPSIFFTAKGSTSSFQFDLMSDPPRPTVVETMSWLTDIIKPKYSDGEQRIALRKIPRQGFKYEYIIKTLQRRHEIQGMFASSLKKLWGIPIWTECRINSSPLLAGSSTIYVDTRYSDFRSTSYAMIWQNESLYEFLKVISKTDSAIILTSPTINTYTTATLVMPVRTGYIRNTPTMIALKSGLTLIDAEFEVIDNATVSGYAATQTYDGLEVVTRQSLIENDEGINESHSGDVSFLDNSTGLLGIKSDTEYNIVIQQHALRYNTAATVWNFRQWLHSLYGRQNIFLVPSYTRDVTLSRAVGINDTIIYITNILLALHVESYDLLQYIGFLNTNGSITVRKISAVANVNSSEESITLTSTIDTVYTTSTTVMFVWKCRFGSDDIELNWQEKDHLVCENGFVRVTQ